MKLFFVGLIILFDFRFVHQRIETFGDDFLFVSPGEQQFPEIGDLFFQIAFRHIHLCRLEDQLSGDPGIDVARDDGSAVLGGGSFGDDMV